MSKSDLNGERSVLSYCRVTHREVGIPACRTEMVKVKISIMVMMMIFMIMVVIVVIIMIVN